MLFDFAESVSEDFARVGGGLAASVSTLATAAVASFVFSCCSANRYGSFGLDLHYHLLNVTQTALFAVALAQQVLAVCGLLSVIHLLGVVALRKSSLVTKLRILILNRSYSIAVVTLGHIL